MSNIKSKKLFLAITFLFVILIIGSVIYFSQKSRENAVYNQLLEDTVSEVAVINDLSEFGGLHLLAIPPREFNASINNYIGGQVELGTYYCSLFKQDTCITHISLQSKEMNLMGICVGDQIEDAQVILSEHNYEVTDNVDYRYAKAYITIIFDVEENGVIEEITVSIVDPRAVQAIY